MSVRLVPWIALGIMLIAPIGHAETDVRIQDGMKLEQGIMVSGALAPDGWVLRDPVSAFSVSATWSAGTLTVCPIDARQSALLTALRLVRPDCPGAQAFDNPVVTFGGRTTLAWAGRYPLLGMPSAAVAIYYGHNDTVALLLPQEPASLGREDDLFRFVPKMTASSVQVLSAGKTHYFNGTEYAFLHDGVTLSLTTSGLASSVAEPALLRVTPSDSASLAMCFRSDVLLDLQAAVVGPDGRESRVNASRILNQFSRLWRVVDGAVSGPLNGTVEGRTFDGRTGVLLRGDEWVIQRAGTHLVVDGRPHLEVQGTAVSVGHSLQQAPWLAFGLLWLAALITVAWRRDPPRRSARYRLLGVAVFAWMLLLAELVIMRKHLGSGIIAELDTGGASLFSAAVLTVLLAVLAWVLLFLPGRIILGRVFADRMLWWIEGAWGLMVPMVGSLLAAYWMATLLGLARL